MILDPAGSERPAKRLRLRALLAGTGANSLAILSLQTRRADAVWTRDEWTAGNSDTPFSRAIQPAQ
jgi:hypothetical protein